MALHNVSAQARSGLRRKLQVDQGTLLQASKRGTFPSLFGKISRELGAAGLHSRKADTAHGHAVADLQLGSHTPSVDGNTSTRGQPLDSDDVSCFLDQPGKHTDSKPPCLRASVV